MEPKTILPSDPATVALRTDCDYDAPFGAKRATPINSDPQIGSDATERDSLNNSGSRNKTPPALPQEYIDATLRFLSTADAISLSAITAGLAIVTYLLLDKIGLVLIGAVGGVVMYVTWENLNPDMARSMKGDRGFDALERLLGNTTRLAHVPNTDDNSNSNMAEIASFADFDANTADALNELVNAVIRDYVQWWYTPIMPSDKSFPAACRQTLISYIINISNHVNRKRPADVFLDLLTNSSSTIVVFFNELANAFAAAPSNAADMTVVDVVYNYLASNPESRLTNLVSQRQQASKFRSISEDALEFLDKSCRDCDPVRLFLREILSGVLLETILQICSKPEWINEWIVSLLEAGEPDFNQAIDVGMQHPVNADFGEINENVGNVVTSNAEGPPTRLVVEGKKAGLDEPSRSSKPVGEEETDGNQKEKEAKKKDDERNAGAEAERQVSEGRASQAATFEPQVSATTPRKDVSVRSTQQHEEGLLASPTTSVPSPRSESPRATQAAACRDSQSSFMPSVDGFLASAKSMDNGDSKGDLSGQESHTSKLPPPMTLYNASITILDDTGAENGKLRNRPNFDFFIQIEPTSSHYPGWMIVRKYNDFQSAHEVLRRLATISGCKPFIEHHRYLPPWRDRSRPDLRNDLEQYLRDACGYQPLAESEALKRFFEKSDQGKLRPPIKSTSGIEAFGKNMFGALTSAPKGALEGGKAVVEGVQGVLGNIGLGQKRSAAPASQLTTMTSGSTANGQHRSSLSLTATAAHPRNSHSHSHSQDSEDSQRWSPLPAQSGPGSGSAPPVDGKPRCASQSDVLADTDPPTLKAKETWNPDSIIPGTDGAGRNAGRAASVDHIHTMPLPASLDEMLMHLPPRPSDVTDDYSPVSSEPMSRMDSSITLKHESLNSESTSKSSSSRIVTSPSRSKPASNGASSMPANPGSLACAEASPSKSRAAETGQRREQHQGTEQAGISPLTDGETRIAVELIFTVISELYTLSPSAWTVRRAILVTAKSFLLRPGNNPSLHSIQQILDSALTSWSSQAAIAQYIRGIRANSLPTQREREQAEAVTGGGTAAEKMSQSDKEALRLKARRLMIDTGMPAALSGIMGHAATAEAVGRVFDALQIEELARGLVFAVMIQALRILTH